MVKNVTYPTVIGSISTHAHKVTKKYGQKASEESEPAPCKSFMHIMQAFC